MTNTAILDIRTKRWTIMKWKELIVNILSINTALYAILVIVNPNNYFGNGETTKLLALEQILSYPNR